MGFGNLAPNQLFALPGGSAAIDPSVIIINGVPTEVKWAQINANTSGNTSVVAAVTAKRIRVLSIDFVCAAAVTVGWQSAANAVRANQSFAANSGMARDLVFPYYVQTTAGEALNINLGGNVAVVGMVGYVEV